jgi:hypothetical protein
MTWSSYVLIMIRAYFLFVLSIDHMQASTPQGDTCAIVNVTQLLTLITKEKGLRQPVNQFFVTNIFLIF